ncbi:MAG: TPM domain-containing protein [Oscillospiraceae bacterium]|nr:TPM domain-containing protein [Oscillospiraceae bacterium]
MKRKMTALLTALLLVLALGFPAMAAMEYGAVYDETEALGSVELTYQGEQKLPQLTEALGVDLRVDVFTDEGVEDISVSDIAVYVYENSGYGCGAQKDGVSLTLLLRGTEDGVYTLSESDWCVYALLDTARGSAQDLSGIVHDAVSPYMDERAWNGEDVTMSATALSQAVDAMAESVENYIRANAVPDVTGETAESQTQEPTDADMNYIFDLSDQLSYEEWAELEARASDISQRHGCGVYAAFVDDFTEYGGGNDVYKTTYQLYHASELGMGADRDGIIILLSMDDRDYAMFVYGDHAEYAFDRYGQKELEDAFLGYFGDNDWYGGVSHYLDTCDEYLTRAEEGKPVRKNTLPMYLIVVVASCAIAGGICLMLKWQMKTVHKKAEANEYVAAGGLNLTKQYDRYTHTTETRRKIHDDSDSNSGTSSCSGGGGSGRSGKF